MHRQAETRASGTQTVDGATVTVMRSAALVGVLPGLRCYARAMAGSPASGDHYFRQFLEVFLSDPNTLASEDDIKLQCFVLFHKVCSGLDTAGCAMAMDETGGTGSELAPLLPIARELFLLVYLGGVTLRQAARIVGIAESEAGYHLLTARLALRKSAPTTVSQVIAMKVSRFSGSSANQYVVLTDQAQQLPGPPQDPLAQEQGVPRLTGKRDGTRACEEALEVWETEGGAVAPGMVA